MQNASLQSVATSARLQYYHFTSSDIIEPNFASMVDGVQIIGLN